MKTQALEKDLIWEMVINDASIPFVFKTLTTSDFAHYNKAAEAIFEAWQGNQPIERELMSAGVKVSQFSDASMVRSVSMSCELLKKLNTSNNLKKLFHEAEKNVPEKDIEDFAADIQQRIIHTIAETKNENPEITNIIQEFYEYQAIYEEKKKNGGKLLGLETGFPKLDEIIDGLRPGHLWIIGGYTNLGKTYASLNILSKLIKDKQRTVFYSLEMSRVDILARILGILTEQNGASIAKGYGDKVKEAKALKIVEESRSAIYSTKSDLNQILLSMYEESIKDKPALFVIDFLQLITVKNARSEYETTTQTILELQNTAKRLNIPVIVLSQVSNESAKNGDQTVMGFKGSGAIAAAADLAIELVSGEQNVSELREKMKNEQPVQIKWHVKKNRHGRVGTLDMEFTGKHGIFKEYEF